MKKTKQATVRDNPIPALNVHDWRVSMLVGLVTGMLIVGLPKLIGLGLLLCILVLSLKMVEKDRL